MAKTREEYIQDQENLLAGLRTKVQDYNAAVGEKRVDDAATLNAALEKDVSDDTTIAELLCHDACHKAEDPMKAACLTMHYQVIGIKDTLIGEEVKVANVSLSATPMPKTRLRSIRLSICASSRSMSRIVTATALVMRQTGTIRLSVSTCCLRLIARYPSAKARSFSMKWKNAMRSRKLPARLISA